MRVKTIKKIIIFLFEKYAYDYWVDIQMQKERDELKLKYDVDDSEIDDLMIELAQEPYSRAYDAGRQDGVNNVIDNPKTYFED